jgi:hypothetical protein
LHLIGKASGLDHIWPDLIDHQKPELNASFLVINDYCILTGQIWSIPPAFAINKEWWYYHQPLFKFKQIVIRSIKNLERTMQQRKPTCAGCHVIIMT